MILVHLAKGFEETEAVAVMDVLRRANIDAHFVSLGVFRQVIGAHGIMIEADYRYDEIDYGCCEMIVLPGGMDGTKGLASHRGVKKQLLNFAREGKGIAAICAAPMILGQLGILEGRKATIYPGMEEHLIGAEHVEEDVVRDINIITSRGPSTAMAFGLAIVEFFKGKEAADEVAKGLLMI